MSFYAFCWKNMEHIPTVEMATILFYYLTLGNVFQKLFLPSSQMLDVSQQISSLFFTAVLWTAQIFPFYSWINQGLEMFSIIS